MIVSINCLVRMKISDFEYLITGIKVMKDVDVLQDLYDGLGWEMFKLIDNAPIIEGLFVLTPYKKYKYNKCINMRKYIKVIMLILQLE